MSAAIRFPNTCDAIKNAQKYPKNNPLFPSFAHSATYFPCATHSTPDPTPFTAAENIISPYITSRVKIRLSLFSGYNAAGREHRIQKQ